MFLCPWDFPGKNTGVCCHFLLQEIFPTQGLNPGLPHCRQTLYPLRSLTEFPEFRFLTPWAVIFINSTPCWPHGPAQAFCPGWLLPVGRELRSAQTWGSLWLPFRLLRFNEALWLSAPALLAVETAVCNWRPGNQCSLMPWVGAGQAQLFVYHVVLERPPSSLFPHL